MECKYCGRTFSPKKGGEKYCSIECHYRWMLANSKLNPHEEMEIRMHLSEESRPHKTCEGCAYLGSSKCGTVKIIQHSSSAASYMKYRDGRCKQK